MTNQKHRLNFRILFTLVLLYFSSTAQETAHSRVQSSVGPQQFTPLLPGSCNNLDFKNGTAGWDGKWCSTAAQTNYGTPAGALPVTGLNGSGGANAFGYVHELVTAGIDPHTGISRVPPGHTAAIRLGDDKPLKTAMGSFPFNHQMIRNTFTVTKENPTITYWYAVVFDQERAQPHTITDQPYFRIRLFDQLGRAVACASYDVNATTGTTGGFITRPLNINVDAVYKDWVPIYIPLIEYVGQQMTIQFESSDCSQGGHFGYAYVAVDCNPYDLITSSPFICGTNTVNLTAPGGASTYLWTGPGVIPPNNTQTVTINKPGKYKVTMSVIGNSGITCTYDLDTVIIGSSEQPKALFTNTTVCVGNQTKFTDGSTTAAIVKTWSWDFNGDGVEDSNVQNPSYQFPAAGTYPVTLIVNKAACSDKITVIVTVDPGPILTITNPPPVCLPTLVDITLPTVTAGTIGTGTLSYWKDAAATIPLPNPNAIAVAGTYYIKITSVTNCSDTKPVVVSINSSNPIIITDPAPVCGSGTVDITDPAITAGSVDLGVLSYWSDAAFSIPLPNPKAVTTGTYYIKSTPPSGCASVASVKVTINDVATVNAGTAKGVCPGQIVELNGTFGGTATSVEWSGGAGVFLDKSNTLTSYTPTDAEIALGTITLTLTTNDPDGACPAVSSDVILTFYQNPVIKFLADKKKGCPVHCVNFTDSSLVAGGKIASWKWNFGDPSSSSNTSTLPNPRHCFENTGFYDISLTVTSNQGCVSSLTVPKMIQVFAIPIAAFKPTPNLVSMYDPKTTLVDGSSSDVVHWAYQFGDGDSLSSTTKSPAHVYPGIAFAVYTATLKVKNADGCVNYAEGKIEIAPEFTFYIPNAFTPTRDDGHNDTFFGKGIGIVEYNIWIFDRWGNMVFTTTNINTGWDGRANNGEDVAQQDVFVWKVKLKDIFGKWHDYIGTVTIVK